MRVQRLFSNIANSNSRENATHLTVSPIRKPPLHWGFRRCGKMSANAKSPGSAPPFCMHMIKNEMARAKILTSPVTWYTLVHRGSEIRWVRFNEHVRMSRLGSFKSASLP
eukprot:CAMPEP_0206538304 /NCGR_PEP_ID=MMETSP0325_2-20121206/7786_1 /ASSEMBLY_ACC=CAM_ASM_000347 /TAXON_ID=2866 /ORGANISM="Crypthecodinium cohnii, Strain Seligo" /LENGTH=109 /DNA_ID=CAMNT_0054035723 /DNA_START=197 /DNA_END=523 /DNA_ORIENTATION=-